MKYFSIGGIVLFLGSLLVSYLIIPEYRQDAPTITAVIMLAVALSFAISVPDLITGFGRTNKGSVASIGTSSFIIIMLMLTSGISLAMALSEMPRNYVLAMETISLSIFVASALVNRAAIGFLDNTKCRSTNPDFIFQALTELSKLQNTCADKFKIDLNHLSETIRFSRYTPSDLHCEHESKINSLIVTKLKESIEADDENAFDKNIKDILQILYERERV